MAEPRVREPETTWGYVRALIQAGTGVAFVLEEMPRIGVFLFAVAACTVAYETVQWGRARRRRAAADGSSATPTVAVGAATRPTAVAAPGTTGRSAAPFRRPAAAIRRAPWPRADRGARAAR